MAGEITIIGLGPGDPKWVTRGAWDEIQSADEVFLRTKDHPVVSWLPKTISIYSFDDIYEEAEDFAEVYSTIVNRLIQEASQREKIIYAVPGDPSVGEATVAALRSRSVSPESLFDQ